ncbi:peptidoglycan recognition protein [Streptomyces sp. SKN60]|uniref:peptidoglycan recognition protein family protein n=1 Tax=Streptomyces sp. SKN60 TaxID=2855506 RepID=UPI002247375A|nr:peptidoglycan recognition protein [Streptomyces sp. SKN60]MCX2185583.1 peptidoglycan recognition protein [Streptomyces sp. SKN60]
MRAYLASSIAVTCAAALALPLALTTPAGAAAPPAAPPAPPAADRAANPASYQAADPAGDLAGSTQSLPLEPLAAPETRPHGRAFGRPEAAAGEKGLTRREVRPFSLVGVVWNDARTPLHGTVQVRTRATADGAWSDWQDVETHNEEHGADPGTAEGRSGALRGATAPLWVGDSDGVEVRVRPEPEERTAPTVLPAGLRLELVDPGPDPAAGAGGTRAAAAQLAAAPNVDRAAAQAAASSVNAEQAPFGATVIPALTREETLATMPPAAGTGTGTGTTANRAALAAKPYIGPRPKIITRKGWGADEKMREKAFGYTKTIKAAFVHHSATGNNYTCKQAPSVLRSIYRYHVKSLGWRDFGYNFAVDKCGNIYEGRAGGVAKPVLGAHTLGFNTNSMGVVVLGTFGSATPPAAVVTAVAKLTAWKLGLHGVNPKGKVTLTSGGGNLYKKGKKVKFNAISGHRDGFATECPGGRLYSKLGTARSSSAKLQGRS